MNMPVGSDQFQTINKGYNTVFQPNKLSIGLVVPLEPYANRSVPTMDKQLELIQLAESLGFAAIWLRDIPFNVPSFGDAGQVFDPFVYLGLLAGQTSEIALGVSSIILPLRHPAHVAKAASSVDVLSEGRLILGVASGDRAEEYPAFNLPYETRGERFRESIDYIKKSWEKFPNFNNAYGQTSGYIDLIPKPHATRLPLLITGGSQQSPDWLAENGDGWMIYPRGVDQQAKIIKNWRRQVKIAGRLAQPVMQPLYIDLREDAEKEPRPIHLGFSSGSAYLRNYLAKLRNVGVNHVALNLRFNQLGVEDSLKRLAREVLPEFL